MRGKNAGQAPDGQINHPIGFEHFLGLAASVPSRWEFMPSSKVSEIAATRSCDQRATVNLGTSVCASAIPEKTKSSAPKIAIRHMELLKPDCSWALRERTA